MRISFKIIKRNLRDYLTLAKGLKADKRVPKASKVLLGIAIGYFFMPIDIIPDFIPVIGHLDDLIIVPLLIFVAIKLVPKEVFRENYRQVFNR